MNRNHTKRGPYKKYLLKGSNLSVPRQTLFNQSKKRRLEKEKSNVVPKYLMFQYRVKSITISVIYC